ncbi:MAG: 5' nucleotidase, NT5C type [Desulfobulbus sp.]|jgi:5'(3')-deoxyribonucleotidase
MPIHQPAIDPAEIGFDFDGVVADTVEAFLRIACVQHAICDLRPEDITSFSVEESVDMNAALIESIFNRILHDSVGTGLLPMPGAVEVISALSKRARITIVTARPEPLPVREWLRAFFPEPVWRRVHLVAMGDHDDKVRHVRELGLTTFVDDRAETCRQMDQAGIRAIVFDQPWNRGRHNLPAVRSWQDIHALCFP